MVGVQGASEIHDSEYEHEENHDHQTKFHQGCAHVVPSLRKIFPNFITLHDIPLQLFFEFTYERFCLAVWGSPPRAAQRSFMLLLAHPHDLLSLHCERVWKSG